METENSLEELYYAYEEKIFKELDNDKEYLKNYDYAETDEALVMDLCNDTAKKLLSKCMDEHNDKAVCMMRVAFKYGFSLANKLMVESLKNDLK